MDKMVAMETLVAVVEAGSFSGAARLLEVGQPAVSKTVAQLEEQLGVRLLIRSTRGLTPTEAGTRFYEHARRAIEAAQEAEMAARGSDAQLTGRLRVSAAVTFARMHVVPYLGRFLAEHPQLSVDVLLEDGNVDLMALGVDVALRMGNLGDSSMTARRIAQSRRVVLGSPRYFEQAGEPMSPADLASHQAIVYDRQGGGTTWAFRHGSTEISVEVSGRLRVTAAEGVRAAVLGDLGVAIASEWMFAPEIASGAVRPVLTEWTLPAVDLWAVFPAGRLPGAKARAFVAFVEATLRDAPGQG
ncbi:LysR family transcriptional regulator [Cupriavidus sp. YR651]|uniref:LysR family transcriptional regulator n=1 Tax=Cupriavidus sp. YR651 TaxID=1855315 RepID=UPI000B82261F|nr:LysR family transcriptional regulator [Cupriavidus sp. YR651]